MLTLTLQNALDRAKANSQQLLSADIAARIAHEDKVQAKAALLPTLNWENDFVYTQPNGSDTGVFVANNGPRVYTNRPTCTPMSTLPANAPITGWPSPPRPSRAPKWKSRRAD